MARKRLIAPQFFTHGDLFDAEQATGLPIRLAFAGLWGQSDRRGVFAWRPRELKLAVLPYDPCDMSAVLDALEHHGFIRSYEAAGKRWGFIPSFKDWQTFHKDEKASSDPAPPAEMVTASSYAVGPTPRVNDAGQQEIFAVGSAPSQHPADPTEPSGRQGANMPIAVAVPIANAVAMTERGDPSSPSSARVLAHIEPQQPHPSDSAPPIRNGEPESLLRAMASPSELLAFDLLLSPLKQRRLSAVEAICAIAAGHRKHRVVGKDRVAGPADVMRAAAEMAVNGDAWNIDLFRGYVRRLVNRPEDTLAETECRAVRVGQMAHAQDLPAPPSETPEQIQARRAASREALQGFRALYAVPPTMREVS